MTKYFQGRKEKLRPWIQKQGFQIYNNDQILMATELKENIIAKDSSVTLLIMSFIYLIHGQVCEEYY